MTTEQPLALKLADALQQFHNPDDKQASAELRRLHKWEEIFSEWDGPEDVHEMLCDQAKDINHLKADNAKLRKALELVAAAENSALALGYCKGIALAALAQGEVK
jgi:cytochrome c1